MAGITEIVDENEVIKAIRELYGLRESDMDFPGIAERVRDLDDRVERPAERDGLRAMHAKIHIAAR